MSIHLIIGPMFSGKTSELIRLKNRSFFAGEKCVLIKYSGDVRYNKSNTDKLLYTHDGKGYEAFETNDLSELKYEHFINKYTHFFIDEIQFYNNPEIIEEMANIGKHFVLSGLQGDFNKNIFNVISYLIPKCEKITHLTAIDINTKKDAAFTYRLCNNKEVKLIGGSGEYQAVTRETYNNNLNI